MKIAVASRDGVTVAGHVGKCKNWIVFQVDTTGASPLGKPHLKMLELITLPKALVFHHYKNDAPHPLAGCVALIGASAGEGFASKTALLGIEAVITDESDPAQAVKDYLNHQTLAIEPHLIGELNANDGGFYSSEH